MQIIPSTLAALALLGFTAMQSVAAADSGPTVSYFKLENGLELVVIPDRRAPVVTHMAWYKVGSADETPGKSGLAHFLEHLLFKGTVKYPGARFSQTVARLGGQENAFTSSDYTGYYQRVAREHLSLVMDMEADRMTGLVLNDVSVLAERDVVLEEWNQRVGNNPAAMLGEQVEAALYVNHPYGRPVIGWRPEIEKLTPDDALAFYRRFYTPNNAVVVVAGDVDTGEVRALTEQTYGKVPRVAEPGLRQRPQEPEPRAPRQVTLADPRVAQPSLQRSYLVPSYAVAKPGEAEALEVLAHILAGGSNSRLYRKLVMEKGLASAASGYYQGSGVDATRVALYVTPQPGIGLAQLEEALDAVLADVQADGVSAAELERSKSRLIADAAYAQDNQATLARWYGTALTTGSTVEDVRAWPDRVRAVTAERVHDAARRWLEKRRSVTGYLVKDLNKSEEKRS